MNINGIVLMLPPYGSVGGAGGGGVAAPVLTSPADAAVLNDYTPTFTWAAVAGADTYEIQIATDGTFTTILDSATGLLVTTYTPGSNVPTATAWRVRAIDQGIPSAWSSRSFSFLTLAAPVLSSPTDADVLSDYTPTFTWAAVTNAISYEIQIANNIGFSPIELTGTPTPATYTPGSDLTYAANHYWRVRAISGDVQSAWSSIRSFGLWMLYDEFSTIDQPPLVSPRTAEPGPGTLTFTDSLGRGGIANDILAMGTGVGSGDPYIRETVGRTRVNGRTFRVKNFKRVGGPLASGNPIFGWATSLTPLSSNLQGLLLSTTSGGGQLNLADNGAFPIAHNGASILDNLFYTFDFVLDDNGFKLYLVQNGKLTKYWKSYNITTTPMYPAIYSRNANDLPFLINALQIRDLPAPFNTEYGAVTVNDTTLTSGDTFTGTADGIFDFFFTLPVSPSAGDEIALEYRRTDASNKWKVYFKRNVGNTAWDFLLDSVAAGTPTNRITSTGISASDALRVIVDGSIHQPYRRVAGGGWAGFAQVNVSYLDHVTGLAIVAAAGTTLTRVVSWPMRSAAEDAAYALPSAPTYLLKDYFYTSAAVNLAASASAEPTGLRKKHLDSTNLVRITVGKLKGAGTAAVNFTDPAYYWTDAASAGFPRVAGRAAIWKGLSILTSTARPVQVGLDSNATPDASLVAGVYFVTAGVLSVRIGADNPTVGAWAVATYDVAIVEFANGYAWFIRGGVFLNWTLLFVNYTGSDATLWPNIQAVATFDYELAGVVISDLGATFDAQSDLATVNDTTLTSGDTFTGTADAQVDFLFTLPGSPAANDEVSLLYRYQDASNYWKAYIKRNVGNTAWDFRLDSVLATVATNRIAVTGVGTPDAIKVNFEASLHDCYTRAAGVWTKRGAQVNVAHMDARQTLSVVAVAGTTLTELNSYPRSGRVDTTPLVNVTVDTQTLGAELVTNGNFAAWTADNPNSWTIAGEVASDPMVNEVGAGEGQGGAGTGKANFYSSATANAPTATQTILAVGSAYEVAVTVDTVAAGSIDAQDGSANMSYQLITTGAKKFLGRATSTGFRFRGRSGGNVTIDDASVKLITPAAFQVATADGAFELALTLPGAPTAGQDIWLLYRVQDASNYWMASLRRNDANTQWDVRLDSVVAGVITNRIATVTNVGTIDTLRIRAIGLAHVLETGVGGVYTHRGVVSSSVLQGAVLQGFLYSSGFGFTAMRHYRFIPQYALLDTL